MSKQDRFTDHFTRDAIAQVIDQGYPVRKVAGREHEFDLCVATVVFAPREGDPGGRCASRRDPPPEVGSGACDFGSGHLKKPARVFARLCAVETACAIIASGGSCRSLIGGTDSVKKHGTWTDTHLKAVTPPWR